MSRADPLERVAAAAERVADALEYLARATVSSGPQPQLKVARGPTDTSPMEPVTLRPAEGLMMAIIQNVGDAETLLERPTARLGEVEIVGELLGRDSRPQTSMTAPAKPGGPGVTAQFQFDRGAEGLADLPLLLRLPHRPGQMPGTSILEVRLEPAGEIGGRYNWRAVNSQVVPQAVDALFDDVQAYAALAQLGAEGHEMQDRAAEAVQARDLQRVAVAQQAQHVVELWAGRLGAAGVVDVDVVASDAGALQRVDLMAGVLVSGRDAGVAEEHLSKIRDRPVSSS